MSIDPKIEQQTVGGGVAAAVVERLEDRLACVFARVDAGQAIWARAVAGGAFGQALPPARHTGVGVRTAQKAKAQAVN